MASGGKNSGNHDVTPVPAGWREALQWFVNSYGTYYGSVRGLILSDWADEQAVSLEAAIIKLKARGFSPFVVAGETIYQQAEYLFNESKDRVSFSNISVSALEEELKNNDVVIVDDLFAPEKPAHLWYLIYYLLFPRAIAGKAIIITTALSLEKFKQQGRLCPDFDFCGRSVSFEKLLWLIESGTISLDTFKLCRENSLPPMLKGEYDFFMMLHDRGLPVVGQYVLGDCLLDFALIQDDKRLDIECESFSALSSREINAREEERDRTLLADGWEILKFSSFELGHNLESCVDAVSNIWSGNKSRLPQGCRLASAVLSVVREPCLDAAQESAITSGGGPLALAGGAGTGKTNCLAGRIAYLLARGISPETVLSVSYSRESARGLRRCLEKIIDKQQSARLPIMSFHDLGMKILRENLADIKRKPPLKIEANPQKVLQKLLSRLRKELEPSRLEAAGKLDEFYVAAVIAMYKAHLFTAAKVTREAQGESEELIARLYQLYEDHLRKTNRIDRNDSCRLAAQILLENESLRLKYQSLYEFVLVDEYQDITVAQDMLVRLLACPQDNLFVAGDEDETICEINNSCPELLIYFSFRYPHAATVLLEHNWRSHPLIVEHAGCLLSGLERRKIKKNFVSAWATTPGAAIFGPQPCLSETEEVVWVVQQIKAIIDAGRDPGHIAVLYRQNHYQTLLEAELARFDVRFLAGKSDTSVIPDEVADMLAFLKLVMDPDGPRAREAFERVCQLSTREINPKLSATIASFASANNLSHLKAVEIYAEATGDQSSRELEQLVRIIRAMHQDKLPPFESIGYLRRTRRLNDYYKSIKIPPGHIYEPLKKLGFLEQEARRFDSVAEFVQHVEERLGEDEYSEDVHAVQVKSVFDVKGFECAIVFICGLAQGIMPSAGACDLEEERRLFYVAFTRAKEAIYLSYPVQSEGKELLPSRFLGEARLIAENIVHLATAKPAGEGSVASMDESVPASIVETCRTDAKPELFLQTGPVPLADTASALSSEPSLTVPGAMLQQHFAGFGTSAQELADLAYTEYLASLRRVADVEHEEKSSGDPYYSQKEKVSGLSPYVDNSDSINLGRSGSYLPPAKGAGIDSSKQAESGQSKSAANARISDELNAESALSDSLRAEDVYRSVPPLPPPLGKNSLTRLSAAETLVQKSVFADAADSELVLPESDDGSAGDLKARLAAASTNVPAPESLPVRPKMPGHEYRAAVDINQLQALKSHNAYFAPLLHGQKTEGDSHAGLPLCPVCGNELEIKARFCGECGHLLPERINACNGCGMPLEPLARFCGECGQSAEMATEKSPADNQQKGRKGWMGKILKFLEN